MTKRTIANRLSSYVLKVHAEQNHTSWWDNPRELPLPTLPSDEALEGKYLRAVCISQPERVREIATQIGVVKGVRSGEISYRGKRGAEL